MTVITRQYLNKRVLSLSNLYDDIFKDNFLDALLLKYKTFMDKTELFDELINSSDCNVTVTHSANYHNTAAESYLSQNDYGNAIKSYQKSLEIEPNQAYVFYRIGIIFEVQEVGLENITKYYIMAIMLDPDFTVVDNNLDSMLCQSKGFYNAIQWYIKEAETNPDSVNNPDLYFNLGRYCFSVADIENAIKCFLISTRLNPNNALAYFNLGLLYDLNGSLDESISRLLKTIELEPEFADAYFILGHKYFKKMDFHRAALSYIVARELDPVYNMPNQSLGNIYQNFQIG